MVLNNFLKSSLKWCLAGSSLEPTGAYIRKLLPCFRWLLSPINQIISQFYWDCMRFLNWICLAWSKIYKWNGQKGMWKRCKAGGGDWQVVIHFWSNLRLAVLIEVALIKKRVYRRPWLVVFWTLDWPVLSGLALHDAKLVTCLDRWGKKGVDSYGFMGRRMMYAILGDRRICTIEYGRVAEFEGDKLWKPDCFIREVFPGGFEPRIHEPYFGFHEFTSDDFMNVILSRMYRNLRIHEQIFNFSRITNEIFSWIYEQFFFIVANSRTKKANSRQFPHIIEYRGFLWNYVNLKDITQ